MRRSIHLLLGPIRFWTPSARRQLGYQLLEVLALIFVQNTQDLALAGGARVLDLVLQALVVLDVVVQNGAKLVGLLGAQIQVLAEPSSPSRPSRLGAESGQSLITSPSKAIRPNKKPLRREGRRGSSL